MLVIIFVVVNTIARYESESSSKGDIEVAFYLLKEDYQSMTIKLSSMEPRSEPYVYDFTIANNDGTNRTQTDLEYNLKIKTTTNLNLRYELYMNEKYNDTGATSIISSQNIEKDEDETYFRTIETSNNTFVHTTNQKNEYQLVIYFPEEYKSIDYQDIIEGVEIIVDSKQIIK